MINSNEMNWKKNNYIFFPNFVFFNLLFFLFQNQKNYIKFMPLIVIAGFPSSGKTTRALELKKFFEQEFQSDVVLINEESFSIDKSEGYKGKIFSKKTFPNNYYM